LRPSLSSAARSAPALSLSPYTTLFRSAAIGFANAVLRVIASRDFDAWIAELAPDAEADPIGHLALAHQHPAWIVRAFAEALGGEDRKSTRLNSSHVNISYAVFCLKKKI